MEFLRQIPTDIPVGKILIHNSVKPAARLGDSSFRAWLDKPGPQHVECSCGWAVGLGKHYRVRLPGGQ